jgi:hypothetical protein
MTQIVAYNTSKIIKKKSNKLNIKNTIKLVNSKTTMLNIKKANKITNNEYDSIFNIEFQDIKLIYKNAGLF